MPMWLVMAQHVQSVPLLPVVASGGLAALPCAAVHCNALPCAAQPCQLVLRMHRARLPAALA